MLNIFSACWADLVHCIEFRFDYSGTVSACGESKLGLCAATKSRNQYRCRSAFRAAFGEYNYSYFSPSTCVKHDGAQICSLPCNLTFGAYAYVGTILGLQIYVCMHNAPVFFIGPTASFTTRSYSGALPGPTIRVTPGTSFQIVLTNTLENVANTLKANTTNIHTVESLAYVNKISTSNIIFEKYTAWSPRVTECTWRFYLWSCRPRFYPDL